VKQNEVFNIWGNLQSFVMFSARLDVSIVFSSADIKAVFDSIPGTMKHVWNDCHHGCVIYGAQGRKSWISSAKNMISTYSYTRVASDVRSELVGPLLQI
jgi:hypothetical protein